MKNLINTIAVSVAVALAAPAVAQTFATRHSMAEKYRDAGAKPAGGRSGSAAIEVRALIDSLGITDVEVTTGHFEGPGGGGTLGKVQVKLFAQDGYLLQTDNYRKSASGVGTASFSYDGFHPGELAQVQANVSGIDPNRNDVVTVSTEIKRRPDLKAMSIDVMPKVLVNAPVVVRGVMAEVNGDVGARATCRLFADGVEIAAIPGAWVDANTAVNCEFRTSFASLGTKQLALRVTDVAPRDYDIANNEVVAAIEVTDRNVTMGISAWEKDDYGESDSSRTRVILTQPLAGSYVRHTTTEAHYQGWFALISRPQDSVPDGRITLRHSSGGVPLPMVSVLASDLGDFDGACYYGYLTGGETIMYCTGFGATDIYVYRSAGIATYTGHQQGTGAYAGSSSWVTVEGDGLPRIAIGADYTAELRHETGGAVFGGSLTVALHEETWEQGQPWSCGRGWDPASFATTDCFSYWFRSTMLTGGRYEY